MTISWRSAMSVGVASLDDDHKTMIGIINQIDGAIEGSRMELIGPGLEALLAYAGEHFQREDVIMARVAYPDIEFHQKLHRGLSSRLLSLDKSFRAASSDSARRVVARELSGFLQGWLSDHILVEDIRLTSHLPRRAATEAAALPPRRQPESKATAPPSTHPSPRPPMAVAPSVAVSSGVTPAPARGDLTSRKSDDVEYVLPPDLADLMDRLAYVVPQVPPPSGHYSSFDALCDAAVNRRANKILVFFQRNNPAVVRELPTFCLASPEFAEKFRIAVTTLILPKILDNRQVRQSAASRDWSSVDDEMFWDKLDRHLCTTILHLWMAAWDALKLVTVKKDDGSSVLQVKEGMRELRAILEPSTGPAYDLPRIGNREIEIFKSLLDTTIDWWPVLNDTWARCHDLYEQEKEPRVFQSRARPGALRDDLLGAFGRFPDSWCDFLVLACHRVFPRLTTEFLDSFVASIAPTHSARENFLPYTMRYLQQAKQTPRMRERENREEIAFQAKMKRVRDHLTGRTTG